MNDNSINFGSTKILYNQSKSLMTYLDKIKNCKEMKFELKGFANLEHTPKLKPNQVAVIANRDALYIRGENKTSDEFVHRILTHGNLEDKSLSYVDDFNNTTKPTFNTII